MAEKQITAPLLREMKLRQEKISVLTAYDYPTARILDEAGIDVILVGDSLANVVLGYDTTLPVTMDIMVHHAAAVARAVERALVVADMPFLSYQVNDDEAVRNAGRLLQEAGVQAVKLEGGREMAHTIERIVGVGIPVMGHLGLTPQSVNQFGGYKLRAKEQSEATRLLEDAQMLEQAGVFAIVLEKIPMGLAAHVSQNLHIPTIGIGAGPDCDGQVLVVHDILGMFEKFTPKFVKRYANIGEDMKNAFREYIDDVKTGRYPAKEQSYE
jgi:3-methyl-2-oxobutanoate hydroxymethyltransferase